MTAAIKSIKENDADGFERSSRFSDQEAQTSFQLNPQRIIPTKSSSYVLSFYYVILNIKLSSCTKRISPACQKIAHHYKSIDGEPRNHVIFLSERETRLLARARSGKPADKEKTG